MSTRRAGQRGVTMIELIMFIVIVSVAVAGTLAALRLSSAATADPLRRKQALMIAEGVMEEVQLAKFTYCDPTAADVDTAASSAACSVPERVGQGGGAGAAREPVGQRPFDNVNDYVNAFNTPIAAFDSGGVLSDANGAPMGLAGYTVRLTIVREPLNGIAAGSAADVGDVLRISVAVSYDNDILVLDGYRTRYAPNAP
jgi:MSHA pilin protein MshD